MIIERREFLSGWLLLAGAAMPAARAAALAQPAHALPAFYADIEKRTFQWFWDSVNRKNGLVPDRWPTPSFCSIAAVGFALPAYAIGVERGWCSRAEARDLTLTTLRFLWNAPQGPEPTGKTGYKGFFYHFIDMDTGLRFRDVELSSVDTTILLMGALFAGQYYDRDDAAEREIRQLSNALYERADWNFFRTDGRAAISMGWHPGEGLIAADWVGFNEGMFVNILALGSPTHPGPDNLWDQWTAPYAKFWRGDGPTRRVALRAFISRSVQPDLHRLPRHPRRSHAQGRLRLFREQPARGLFQLQLLRRQSDGMARILARIVGVGRVRRTGRFSPALPWENRPIPRLFGARPGR